MERYAWKGYVRADAKEEYIRRHNELFWPEMTKMFNECGVHNYSIWMVENEVFGYMDCEDGVDHAIAYQKASEVKHRWDEYMADILIPNINPETGKPYEVKQVFMHF